MAHSLELRIETLLLMPKLDSQSVARRRVQQENVSDISTRLTIQAIYDKYIKTGSLKDRERQERPSVVTEKVPAKMTHLVPNAPTNSG